MDDFLQRLKQRKLVQWTLAYVAFAFALIQVVDVVADSYDWPHLAMHLVFGVLALGFVLVLVLAWYHGERGVQHVSGPELLLIALALAIGGGLLWHFGRAGSSVQVATTAREAATESVIASAASGGAASMSSAAAGVPQSIPAKSIAVLPFENLSNDKDNAYFASGMQDLILTKLADIGDLKVISRTSTEKYKSHPDDLKTIGQQLGVATLLEGSVQKAGNEVLVNVQLIDARTDSHIWAESYTRTLDNVFGVEGDVAGKIAAALKAKLSPAQSAGLAAVPTTNRAAYDAFLRAEYQASLGDADYTSADWKSAIALYRQAVQADPGFALAWARLSFNESTLAWFGGGGDDVEQLDRQARADAERALKLAPDLAAAHLALGYTQYYGQHDYAAALKTFSAVLKRMPNNAGAWAAQGYVQRRMGSIDAAAASLQQALALDPRNSELAFSLGVTCMMARRYSEARQAFQRAQAIDPRNLHAKAGQATAILYETGDVSRALAQMQGDDASLKLTRVSFLVAQRKYAEALALLDGIPDTPENFSPPDSKAQAEADLLAWMMGDKARARPLFERALTQSKAQLKVQQLNNLPGIWINIGDDELGLGHAAAGLAALAKGQAIADTLPDDVDRPATSYFAATTYAQAGRADLATPLLARGLENPLGGAWYAPVMLWLDPGWDPIRHDPRFQALLQKYAKYKPAVTYDVPPIASAASSATAR